MLNVAHAGMRKAFSTLVAGGVALVGNKCTRTENREPRGVLELVPVMVHAFLVRLSYMYSLISTLAFFGAVPIYAKVDAAWSHALMNFMRRSSSTSSSDLV